MNARLTDAYHAAIRRQARELNAQRLRGGFFNISRPCWSLPRLTQERGKWAAGVKAYFRSVK